MSSTSVDKPYPLISTIAFSKDTSHAANYVATQMALAHNGMIRGLNAIYLQATAIPHQDTETVQDFLTYCQCWCESMHHHHDVEEAEFFPDIERITGVLGIMELNIEQHRAFTPGFIRFEEYARTCSAADYEGGKVKELIDGFAGPLTTHLRDEINTLRDLHPYDNEDIRKAYKKFEKRMMAGDSVREDGDEPLSSLVLLTSLKYRTAPLVFGTADRSFEGGMHNFPPVPFFVPYIIHYVYGRKYRGAWRFNPCTIWRDPRDLAFQSNSPGQQ